MIGGPTGAVVGAGIGEVAGAGLGSAYAPEAQEYGQKAWDYVSDTINGYRNVGDFKNCTKQFGEFSPLCNKSPALHVRINK